ncbi:DUF4333 domain-containing protein [Streptomyces sp. TRM66268-LWL]|uniref:DUF4333 domain-containing protein n=1 Tax=Streptomyces polyasparticus TaxID=2767826 RepID=A0ABR7SX78_9ACTN|nr:DUF4333 domain-containing protein [Streptomyces polyasparticus]MBC9718933.1 DUF4333 domain-containing protein [Streptomyces polyasparticus]
MRGVNGVLVAVVLGAALVGCSSDSEKPSASSGKAAEGQKVLPQKLSAPTPAQKAWEAKPATAEPASDAPASDQLAYEIEKKTLAMAHAPGKSTATCPKDVKAKNGERVTCTATYEGEKVTWTVTFGGEGWMPGSTSFQAVPDTGLLTKVGVAKLLYGNYTPKFVACNNIPDVAKVALNQPSKYKCAIDKEEEMYAQGVRSTDAGPRA